MSSLPCSGEDLVSSATITDGYLPIVLTDQETHDASELTDDVMSEGEKTNSVHTSISVSQQDEVDNTNSKHVRGVKKARLVEIFTHMLQRSRKAFVYMIRNGSVPAVP